MSLVLSATPFCTSAGVVADFASLASRSCPETVDAGLSTGLTASSVCFLESGCACTSSFGATTGSLAVASAFSEELVGSTLALGVGIDCSEGRATSTAFLRTSAGKSLFSLTETAFGTTWAGVGLTTSARAELGCPTRTKKPLATTTEATPTLRRRIDQRVYL